MLVRHGELSTCENLSRVHFCGSRCISQEFTNPRPCDSGSVAFRYLGKETSPFGFQRRPKGLVLWRRTELIQVFERFQRGQRTGIKLEDPIKRTRSAWGYFQLGESKRWMEVCPQLYLTYPDASKSDIWTSQRWGSATTSFPL